MKKFLMGNEILALAAQHAGAKIMFGYPITPTTEVLATWVSLAENQKELNLKHLQTEDENSAGFGVCGSILSGVPAFTATSGPGNILMQDAIVMAEALRLPFVGFIGQRGGPSSGTVIYSQQELFLTIFGGNGEGFRIVYSSSNLQDLYNYGKKVFPVAWKYRFPTFLLYDGYQAKMKGQVNIDSDTPLQLLKTEPILKGNLCNIYSQEEQLYNTLLKFNQDFQKAAPFLIEYEKDIQENTRVLIISHGIVSSAVKAALPNIRLKKTNVGYFRPITLWPFPKQELTKALKNIKKILIFESSMGQFSRIVKDQIYPCLIPVEEIIKPAAGFTPEEIEKLTLKQA